MNRREQIEDARIGYRNKFKSGLINLDEALDGMAEWADANPIETGDETKLAKYIIDLNAKLEIAVEALNKYKTRICVCRIITPEVASFEQEYGIGKDARIALEKIEGMK